MLILVQKHIPMLYASNPLINIISNKYKMSLPRITASPIQYDRNLLIITIICNYHLHCKKISLVTNLFIFLTG